jgi:transcriptional regulator with XRE-family HTH domain
MIPSSLIRDARREAGLTQAQLARRSGTSQATLSAYEGATTLARILAAAGKRLTTIPASRPVWSPGEAELERRGHILAQVLDLAERLPARHANALRYPPIGSMLDDAR